MSEDFKFKGNPFAELGFGEDKLDFLSRQKTTSDDTWKDYARYVLSTLNRHDDNEAKFTDALQKLSTSHAVLKERVYLAMAAAVVVVGACYALVGKLWLLHIVPIEKSFSWLWDIAMSMVHAAN